MQRLTSALVPPSPDDDNVPSPAVLRTDRDRRNADFVGRDCVGADDSDAGVDFVVC